MAMNTAPTTRSAADLGRDVRVAMSAASTDRFMSSPPPRFTCIRTSAINPDVCSLFSGRLLLRLSATGAAQGRARPVRMVHDGVRAPRCPGSGICAQADQGGRSTDREFRLIHSPLPLRRRQVYGRGWTGRGRPRSSEKLSMLSCPLEQPVAQALRWMHKDL